MEHSKHKTSHNSNQFLWKFHNNIHEWLSCFYNFFGSTIHSFINHIYYGSKDKNSSSPNAKRLLICCALYLSRWWSLPSAKHFPSSSMSVLVLLAFIHRKQQHLIFLGFAIVYGSMRVNLGCNAMNNSLAVFCARTNDLN